MKHQLATWLCIFALSLGLLLGCGGGGSVGKPERNSDSPSSTGPTGPTGGGVGSGGTGGGGSGGGGSQDLAFRVQRSGEFALTSSPAFPVARTQAEYSAMMQSLVPPIISVAPTPPIDFTQKMVVGIFLGSRPTSGYSVVVTAVERNGDGATVVWEERQPDPGGAGSTVVTSPFVVIVMTKVTGSIDFGS